MCVWVREIHARNLAVLLRYLQNLGLIGQEDFCNKVNYRISTLTVLIHWRGSAYAPQHLAVLMQRNIFQVSDSSALTACSRRDSYKINHGTFKQNNVYHYVLLYQLSRKSHFAVLT